MSSLPPELWDIVFDHLSENAFMDLVPCAQVCRAWNRSATDRFYHSVAVNAVGSSHSNIKRQPPVMSAEAFRYLLDSRSSAVSAIRTLQFNLGPISVGGLLTMRANLDELHECNKCLNKMTLPRDHLVTSLSLHSLKRWVRVNAKLRLAKNFASITLLDLKDAAMESTTVFVAALAQFPLLRSLFFSGTIMDQNFNNGIQPPSFTQPCNLTLTSQTPATLSEVLQ
ncbi:hypothetical protein AURDEDRAFT_168166 [Auricularia subglabra TFB-10046 SS5]|nr:hypothetical protein AURDEDRAFT_168166 [Auricularia subglabra TFB-10046 SS5]